VGWGVGDTERCGRVVIYALAQGVDGSEADKFLWAHPDGALGVLHLIRQGADMYSFIVTSNSTVRECGCMCVYVLAALCGGWVVARKGGGGPSGVDGHVSLCACWRTGVGA
jgi:hypothetical protein